MKKVVALFGKSGAGKDYIMNRLLKENPRIFHKIISYTTRPRRENEIDGDDYYFVNNISFESIDDMIVSSYFNNWHYGIREISLKPHTANIGVFSLDSLKQIIQCSKIKVIPIYVYAEDKTRLIRQLNREENPDVKEIVRRFLSDEKDFENIDIYYHKINNDNKYLGDTILNYI